MTNDNNKLSLGSQTGNFSIYFCCRKHHIIFLSLKLHCTTEFDSWVWEELYKFNLFWRLNKLNFTTFPICTFPICTTFPYIKMGLRGRLYPMSERKTILIQRKWMLNLWYFYVFKSRARYLPRTNWHNMYGVIWY